MFAYLVRAVKMATYTGVHYAYATEELAILVALFVFATFVVGLRLWARHLQRMAVAFNDYMILTALLGTWYNLLTHSSIG